jgi:DinB family
MRARMPSPLSTQEPALGRPGAGVSSIETFVMRKLARPLTSIIPWSTGLRTFQKEGDKILAAIANQPSPALTARVLVPRQLYVEDSSRFWSAAMVARHLIIVGEKMARIIVCLGKGEMCSEPVNVADVKPDPASLVSVFVEYREFLARFGRILREDVINRRSLLTHPHPWAGPMTAHQWLQLAAMHQHIHRVQLERILGALR